MHSYFLGLGSPNPKLMEACLRCLRTVFSRKEAPIDVLYTEASLIPHLVQMAKERSPSVQECVMTMLYCGCQVSLVLHLSIIMRIEVCVYVCMHAEETTPCRATRFDR